ncbi:peptidylprolyl isomerase [Cohnella soli]|uniref:Peptidyl-prolyl cis-trans isomerase n=1 Tax=Cohnella soli TaxID=425005 RepID=A0ABW0HWW8_9BACL
MGQWSRRIVAGKPYAVWAGVSVAFVGCAIALMLLIPQRHSEPTVATVNGEPISLAEFNHWVSAERTEVFQYFQIHYGVREETADFWTKDYEGETPLQSLKKRALDRSVRAKLQQLLARDKGLVRDISYSAFLKQLTLENKRRAAAVKAKEVIYGPLQYTEAAYYDYKLTNLAIELENKLRSSELAFNEEDLRQYYDEAAKANHYDGKDDTKIEKITVSFVDEDGSVNRTRKTAVKSIMEEVLAKLEAGEDFGELAEIYNENAGDRQSRGAQTFDSASAKTDRKYFPQLLSEVSKLKAGQSSGILEIGNAYLIVKCVERKDAAARDFDEVREQVAIAYVRDRYEAYIDNMAQKATVVLRETK